MNYIGAFKCDKCPRNNDPAEGRACPAWWEVTGTEAATGQVSIKKACAFTLMPTFLIEVIKASNRPAAAINEMTNGIIAQLQRMDPPNGQPTPLPGLAARQHFLSNGGE